MIAREMFEKFKQRFGPLIERADLPSDRRLYVFVDRSAVKYVCQHIFRELDARYVITIGADDRPFSGKFLVAHNFAFDKDHLLCSVLTQLPADNPKIDSITEMVPAASWAEREMRDLVGIEPVGHRYLKRLVLPDGWPENNHPLRKDVPSLPVEITGDPDEHDGRSPECLVGARDDCIQSTRGADQYVDSRQPRVSRAATRIICGN